MTLLDARRRALIELERLFDENRYTGCGTISIYVDKGHVCCDGFSVHVTDTKHIASLAAAEINHGLSSGDWDRLIAKTTERIYKQCQNLEQ